MLNTTNPVLMPWVSSVKSVLEMWFSGEEGGTSTARLLLGLADPSGHTDITWPANATDTIWGYNETVPLYPGDTPGPHLERLNGGPSGTTDETEGIFNGYRFFDKEGITPMFPFGWGLSYTRFAYSGLHVTPGTRRRAGRQRLRVTNTGPWRGQHRRRRSTSARRASSPRASSSRCASCPSSPGSRCGRASRRRSRCTSRCASCSTGPPASSSGSPRQARRTVYAGDADSLASLPLRASVTIPSSSNITCDNEQLSAVMVQGNLTVPPR